ncbi:HlyD family type I secretion periplasmic adaptor subunit [Pseudoduganella umbonata]|uniref:Membrane fusion protein (MFP) family protein n=1 Tax=Pseudoduganella umbonata TaxID=864828 RepID=A0A4P8HSN2_9BURK|nr:HlyD family type I secretion periplasmic adaptor subunit [Pseudoduganella umbonata]MBB3220867.1 protease secretion system membrane fusion protein [Pseudoduganella umbonata]QCP11672.1 HlyD family type I secretion periplasmic adaptor subunit [Pseudoduganella umbonata]
MKALTNQTSPTDVVTHDVEPLTVHTDPRSYSRFGWLVVLLGVGGFLLWALLAPLDKGVPLSGKVTKEGNRKAIQHQTGGTIKRILVQEGTPVKAGQVLIEMNDVQARSQLDVGRAQYITMLATEARLLAERDGLSEVTFPAILEKMKSDTRVAETMALQRQLFVTRQTSLKNELAAVDENIAGIKMQTVGLEQSRDSKKEQMEFLKEQLAGMRDLAREGYIARNRLLDLERTYAQLSGAVSEDIGNIGRGKRQVVELTLRRAQRMQDYQKEVRTQLADVQKEVEGLTGRMGALEYDVANTLVRAPVDGVVVGLSVFTNGGVVAAGAKMMDLVPADDPLIVDGQLPVHLIDRVHEGLPVELIFSAFNTNKTPHLPGVLTSIAADSTVDEKTGAAYYHVKAKVTPEGAREIAAKKLEVLPGMPVEVFVKTGERSMMSYLLKPVFDRARTSMSEE